MTCAEFERSDQWRDGPPIVPSRIYKGSSYVPVLTRDIPFADGESPALLRGSFASREHRHGAGNVLHAFVWRLFRLSKPTFIDERSYKKAFADLCDRVREHYKRKGRYIGGYRAWSEPNEYAVWTSHGDDENRVILRGRSVDVSDGSLSIIKELYGVERKLAKIGAPR